MNGKQIKNLFPSLHVYGNMEVPIKNIQIDSRKIKKGDLFVAIKGITFDSHEKIEEAITKGAIGIVTEKSIKHSPDMLIIETDNSRKTYALLSSAFFGFSSRKLKLVGITGTSGKTTTSYLLYKLFNNVDIKSGFIGTIGEGIGDKFVRKDSFPPTTPDAFPLNRFLYKAVKENVKYVFMEVSSFAILHHRIEGLTFYNKILTFLEEDHLDIHKTLENYIQTKVSFFENYEGKIFLNADTPFYEKLKKISINPVLFGIINKANYKAFVKKVGIEETKFILQYNDKKKASFSLNMGGEFNLYNFLAASAFAIEEGIGLSKLQKFAKDILTIPGRMDIIKTKKGIIIVDFAHNPAEIKRVLSFLNSIKNGRIITVIGAVGWSTEKKSREIGKIASTLSDFVIITTDDPRGDDPKKIAKNVQNGASNNTKIILDRKKAIKKAIKTMQNNDIIAILGRGHENEMHYKNKIIYLNDSEYAKEILNDNQN